MSNEIEEAGRAVSQAARVLETEIARLTGLVDPGTGSLDDVSELLTQALDAGSRAGEAVSKAKERVLLWLVKNEGKVSRIEIGDFSYFGERGKKETLVDFPAAFGALLQKTCFDPVARTLLGDVEASEALLGAVATRLSSLLSVGAMKTGAVRKDPDLGPDFFKEHWEISWGDSLKKGDPARKLGVANQRFVDRFNGDDDDE